jgi:hypothetical protein
VTVATEQEPFTVGELIRFWRTRCRFSKLEKPLAGRDHE